MAATPVVSMIATRAALDAMTALLGTAGKIEIRTGAPPATSLTADSGTLLAELPMSNPAFGAATAAEANGKALATANAITTDASANATGTAGHFRMKTSGGVTIFQGTCGTSSADLIFNTVSITLADVVAITAFLIRLANGTTAE